MTDPSSNLVAAYCTTVEEQIDDGLGRIRHCIDQLDDHQLWWRPAESMNSIANLLIHLGGNIRQWLIVGLSNQPDLRDRQSEFDDRSQRNAQELWHQLLATIDEARDVIRQQSAEDLVRLRRVQEFDLSGFQTIEGSVGHFLGHVQEIIYMTRQQCGERYKFMFVPEDQREAQGTQESGLSPPADSDQQLQPSSRTTSVNQELQRQRSMAERALADVSDAQFFEVPSSQTNSIALIVKHLAGNLRSRWQDFLTTDGEKPDRHRDSEFKIEADDTRAALMDQWTAGWDCMQDEIAKLTDSQLDQRVTIRNEPHTVFQALLRGLSHSAYHVGQITLLRRHFQPDGGWLTIEPGKSSAQTGNYLKLPEEGGG